SGAPDLRLACRRGNASRSGKRRILPRDHLSSRPSISARPPKRHVAGTRRTALQGRRRPERRFPWRDRQGHHTRQDEGSPWAVQQERRAAECEEGPRTWGRAEPHTDILYPRRAESVALAA